MQIFQMHSLIRVGSLLSVGFLQQGAPELGPLHRVHENKLSVLDGQAVVDDDVHPVTELPELQWQNRVSGFKTAINAIMNRIHAMLWKHTISSEVQS